MNVFILAIGIFLGGLTFMANVRAGELDSFAPTSGPVSVSYTEAQVIEALKAGNTCVKDGQATLLMSKNLTKKHCRKAKQLGLKIIKVNDLEVNLMKKLTGLN
jgi:hypothetical protein